MRNKSNYLFGIIKLNTILISTLLIFSTTIYSETETASFTVSATVTDTCQNLTASNISFGTYNPLSSSNTDVTGSIAITCTNNTSYSIALSAGNSGSFSARQLNDGGSNNLNYNLYTSSGYSTVWGDGTGSSSTVNQTGTGSSDSTTVYARLPGSQSIPNGSYSDTINVTVTY